MKSIIKHHGLLLFQERVCFEIDCFVDLQLVVLLRNHDMGKQVKKKWE
jgi:hypothetical protein